MQVRLNLVQRSSRQADGHAEDGPRRLRPACADQTADPDDLALAGLEADVVQDALAADPLHAEADLTDGTVALGELLLPDRVRPCRG